MTQLPKDIDFSTLALDKNLQRNPKGGSFAKLTTKGARLSIQTPRIKAPIGLSSFENDNGTAGRKYSIMLSFNGIEASPGLQRLKTFFEHLETFVCDQALAHINGGVKDWAETFQKKQYKKEVFVEGFYRPFLKSGKESKTGEMYPPSISIKLPATVNKETGQENFRTIFYNQFEDVLRDVDADGNSQPLTPESLHEQFPKKSTVTTILDIEGVWIVDRKVSLSVKMSNCKIYPSESNSGPTFIPDDEEPTYDDAVAAAPAPVAAASDASAVDASVMYDAEPEVVIEAAPAEKKRKK